MKTIASLKQAEQAAAQFIASLSVGEVKRIDTGTYVKAADGTLRACTNEMSFLTRFDAGQFGRIFIWQRRKTWNSLVH